MQKKLSNKEKWDVFFLKNALLTSKLSKDPSTKVGAVITTDDNLIVSSGYNGFLRGIEDKPEYYEDREMKLRLTEHAERNALFQAANRGIPLRQCKMYSTHFSCQDCAKGIIQSGVKHFIYITDEIFEKRWDSSPVKQLYDLANVSYTAYSKEKINEISKHYNFTCEPI